MILFYQTFNQTLHTKSDTSHATAGTAITVAECCCSQYQQLGDDFTGHMTQPTVSQH